MQEDHAASVKGAESETRAPLVALTTLLAPTLLLASTSQRNQSLYPMVVGNFGIFWRQIQNSEMTHSMLSLMWLGRYRSRAT